MCPFHNLLCTSICLQQPQWWWDYRAPAYATSCCYFYSVYHSWCLFVEEFVMFTLIYFNRSQHAFGFLWTFKATVKNPKIGVISLWEMCPEQFRSPKWMQTLHTFPPVSPKSSPVHSDKSRLRNSWPAGRKESTESPPNEAPCLLSSAYTVYSGCKWLYLALFAVGLALPLFDSDV